MNNERWDDVIFSWLIEISMLSIMVMGSLGAVFLLAAPPALFLFLLWEVLTGLIHYLMGT
jgi:hypothetical protein